jgi:hypothetical protein
MTTATTWRCRRCKVLLADHIDADWHNTATGHNYFEIPGPGGRSQLVDWRKQMRCDRDPDAGRRVTGRVTSVAEGTTNADLIAAFARLYIRPDDTVMDVTYGRGVFWRKYRHPGRFIAHDLALDGVDFTQLPDADSTMDVTFADPPHGAQGGRTTSTIPDWLDRYGLNAEATRTAAGVLDLYSAGMKEWARVTRPGGLIAVKCSNGVTSGRRQWMHHRIATIGEDLGLTLWDELLLVRPAPGPQPERERQMHAYNRHSYLCVFRVPR